MNHATNRYLPLIFLFFINPASSQSYDCSKAVTETEIEICKSNILAKFDERLAYFYQALKGKYKDIKPIKTDQLDWLKKRNQCKNDVRCIAREYRLRIRSLQYQLGQAIFPPEELLGSICNDLIDMKARDRWFYGDTQIFDEDSIVLDINNDGVNELISECIGGTMHAPCFEYQDLSKNSLPIQDMAFRWYDDDNWTFGLRHFRKDSLSFLLHSYDDALLKPAFLSFITPDNRSYVVCEFRNEEKYLYTPNKNVLESNELCNEIQLRDSDKIRDVYLTDRPSLSTHELRNLGRYESNSVRQGYLDYNNDGIPNYIVELRYTSGAGNGCNSNYFDELAVNRKTFLKSPQRSLLLEMQDVFLKNRHPKCGGIQNRFFEYTNKIYFRINAENSSGVYKIENNSIKEVCGIDKSYTTNIIGIESSH